MIRRTCLTRKRFNAVILKLANGIPLSVVLYDRQNVVRDTISDCQLYCCDHRNSAGFINCHHSWLITSAHSQGHYSLGFRVKHGFYIVAGA